MKEFKIEQRLIDLCWDREARESIKLNSPELKEELKLYDGSKIVNINRTIILMFPDGRNEELLYGIIRTEKGKRFLINKKFRLLNRGGNYNGRNKKLEIEKID